MSSIKIIALGGVRENGKSLYAVEVDEDIYVLDCGLVYPEEALLGIDVVIPDFTYLEENKNRIAGVFLSHGHADAVGALPYFLEHIDAPVFGTELTIELAKLYIKNANTGTDFDDFHVISPNTEIDFGTATIRFAKTTHTIPGSVAIIIKTEDGNIVYTGDFKFDQSASIEYQTNFGKLADIGEDYVLALLSDSTDAESHVENISDRKIAESILETFENAQGRIIVACVASNILRIQQIFDAAYEAGRKIHLTGAAIEDVVKIAMRLDKLTLPADDLIVTAKEVKQLPDEEVVILETGAKGEPIASLQKMAQGRHKLVKLHEGDLVFIATTPSTSMETAIARTKDMIYRAEAEVFEISSLQRASGHATPNELRLMINLLQPSFFIPIQGEYRSQLAHAEIAHELGIPHKNIFIPGKGDVVEIKNGRMSVTEQVPASNVLVDGIGVGDIGNIVLKDRKILSEDGIFVAVVTISRRLGKILSGPQIMSRGFVYMKTSEDLVQEASEIVTEVVESNLASKDFEWPKLKQEVRDSLSRYLFEKTKRRPVILPIIMEASNYKK
ncbi:ribonuclease J [Granulicatella balaenopterae]|uniref:Ribonuclease J n=1 Tax=Granulicatella balaenopterae TaxID=137733 RepID=A0A1H9MRI3_9LACT|nr:ribonuclease J [Granulicatella balaenopterae]SER26324.1 ribonuclease J [Granulicatella balaenopterae]